MLSLFAQTMNSYMFLEIFLENLKSHYLSCKKEILLFLKFDQLLKQVNYYGVKLDSFSETNKKVPDESCVLAKVISSFLISSNSNAIASLSITP